MPTTALASAQMLVHEGLKSVAAGANPVNPPGGIDKAVEAIRGQAREVSGKDEISRVGAISARSEEIGNVIAEAIDKVGVVSGEEGQTFGMGLEFIEGMQFDKGFTNPYFVTDAEQMEAVLEDAFVLLANRKIGSAQDLLPVLDAVVRSGKPLLIIAEDVEGEALSTLIVNKTRGTFAVAAVRAPIFGDRHKRMVEDIAILTGGEITTSDLGLKIENTSMEQLGRASRVVVTREGITIVDGVDDPEAIKGRVDQIRAELALVESDFDREKLHERLARLAGGVAIIKVGAATETELKEKKHHVENALSATRAALEEDTSRGSGSPPARPGCDLRAAPIARRRRAYGREHRSPRR